MRTIYVNCEVVNQNGRIINASTYFDFEGKLNKDLLEEIKETLRKDMKSKELNITFFHILEE